MKHIIVIVIVLKFLFPRQVPIHIAEILSLGFANGIIAYVVIVISSSFKINLSNQFQL